MNNGKICISISTPTTGEMREQIATTAPFAGIIEIRFDSLDASELDGSTDSINQLRRTLPENLPFLFTFRSKEQGGVRFISLEERNDFWPKAENSQIAAGRIWADLEEDLINAYAGCGFAKTICSFHDFERTPETVGEIYSRLSSTDCDIVKIAVKADDITDTIGLWKLLDLAKRGKPVIPIAMGEAGKWTRILSLAHGSPLTYASTDAGSETAPGQITARDLIEIYRAAELGRSTEVYGIIAGNTAYSMSPYIQNAAFKTAGMDRVFVPLQVGDLEGFIRQMVKAETREIDLNFRGFAVTNPHKQTIIAFLDEIDETARMVGAVNTVKIEDGRLLGYNTDAEGFIRPLENAFGDLADTRFAVFGSGGAARACIYALKRSGANVTIVARDLVKAEMLASEFDIDSLKIDLDTSKPLDFDIIVNATPLGTKGRFENETIATAEQLKGVELVYDLTYNPQKTRLIREAAIAGSKTLGGLDMLIAQGASQFEIWTGQTAPVNEMSAAAITRLG